MIIELFSQSAALFDKMKDSLTNWKPVCAAFENPKLHTNDDLGKVEEMMKVLEQENDKGC